MSFLSFESLEQKKEKAYQDINRVLKSLGKEYTVSTVGSHHIEAGAGSAPMQNVEGIETTVKPSMLDLRAKNTSGDSDHAVVRENLYDNVKQLADILKQSGIESEIKDCRKNGDGSITRLLVDVSQENFSTNLGKLLDKHPLYDKKIIAAMNESLSLKDNGEAYDNLKEDTASAIATAILTLQNYSKELGVSNSVQAKLSLRTGRTRTAAD